jgi:hypothetical protein
VSVCYQDASLFIHNERRPTVGTRSIVLEGPHCDNLHSADGRYHCIERGLPATFLAIGSVGLSQIPGGCHHWSPARGKDPVATGAENGNR